MGIDKTIQIKTSKGSGKYDLDNIQVEFLQNKGISLRLLKFNKDYVCCNIDTIIESHVNDSSYYNLRLDSVFSYYTYFKSSLFNIALTKTLQGYHYASEIVNEVDTSYENSVLISRWISEDTIYIYSLNGDLMYFIDLNKYGFNDDGAAFFEGEFGYKPPIGKIIYLDDNGYLILKPNYGVGIYPDVFKFFNGNGEYLFSKFMRCQFIPEQFSYIGDTCVIVSTLGYESYLSLHTPTDSIVRKIADNPDPYVAYSYVKIIENEIVLFHAAGDFLDVKEPAICRYSIEDLSLIEYQIVPKEISNARVLNMDEYRLIMYVNQDDSTKLLSYDNDSLTYIGHVSGKVINKVIRNDSIFVITESEDDIHHAYIIDSALTLSNGFVISKPFYDMGIYLKYIYRSYNSF